MYVLAFQWSFKSSNPSKIVESFKILNPIKILMKMFFTKIFNNYFSIYEFSKFHKNQADKFFYNQD